MTPEQELHYARISPRIEKALNISIVDDPKVYLPEDRLKELIARKPRSYLRYIEKLSDMVSSPDYVGFCHGEETLYFVKLFWRSGHFRLIVQIIAHRGVPKRWQFAELSVIEPGKETLEIGSIPFVKADNHRRGKKRD